MIQWYLFDEALEQYDESRIASLFDNRTYGNLLTS